VPAYDRAFNPPAPVTDVTVANPVSKNKSFILRGKLDTGADITVIPETLVSPLGIRPRSRAWTRGYDGTYAQRPVYYVHLTLEGSVLPAVRCIAADRPCERRCMTRSQDGALLLSCGALSSATPCRFISAHP
jgi:hypothetical protein